MAVTEAEAARAVSLFHGVADDASLSRLGDGLINDTFAVRSGDRSLVLQRVHELFQPEVHINIAAATNHLRDRGFPAPQLCLSSVDNFPWVELEGKVWRLMTRLPGKSVETVQTRAQAQIGARAFARFHSAMWDVAFDFIAFHTDVHDTAGHLRTLETALENHRGHRLYDQLAPMAEAMLRAPETVEIRDDLPKRIVHGDPKIGNVLFGDDGEITGIIDFDTVGPLPLHLELGDLWRSWCNPNGEDAPDACFDLGIFESSLRSYAETIAFIPSPQEQAAIARGVERITLEQSVRFAADVLRESYFGWDDSRFGSAGAHNLARTRNQWALHQQVMATRPQRNAMIDEAFSPVRARSA